MKLIFLEEILLLFLKTGLILSNAVITDTRVD